jgi:hypothetical protein
METDVQQHDDQQAAPDTESWKPEDVVSTQVQQDGMVLITLKDGETRSAPVPKRVTNVEGSEIMQGALAFAAKANLPPDEVLRRFFSNPQPAPQPATQPDPEPETDPLAEIDKQLQEAEAALDLAIEDADGKAQKRLTRELAKLEATRATLELRQEQAVERKQQSRQAEEAQYLETQYQEYDGKALQVLPALGDETSPEKQAYNARWDTLSKEKQADPQTPYILALELKTEGYGQQKGSSLRGSGFTPPGSAPRGRTITINPQQHVANMSNQDALKFVGAL